jgi:hypothetical protein
MPLAQLEQPRAEFSANRQISPDVVALLREAGIYRAFVARRFGGELVIPEPGLERGGGGPFLRGGGERACLSRGDGGAGRHCHHHHHRWPRRAPRHDRDRRLLAQRCAALAAGVPQPQRADA